MPITITFKEQVQALQNALGFASWQFRKGGDPECDRDAEMVDKMHEQVQSETGMKTKY